MLSPSALSLSKSSAAGREGAIHAGSTELPGKNPWEGHTHPNAEAVSCHPWEWIMLDHSRITPGSAWEGHNITSLAFNQGSHTEPHQRPGICPWPSDPTLTLCQQKREEKGKAGVRLHHN